MDENLKVYSLQEAILATQNGLFENVYTVNRSGNIYLRSTRNTLPTDKLDKISISSHQLFYSLNDIGKILSFPAFKNYWKKYQQILLREQQEAKDTCIIIEGHPRIAKTTAQYKLTTYKDIIFTSAKKFDVDPYLLGAILIDEIARLAPFEEITDSLAGNYIGKDTSGGIAQIKTETARGLIRDGYYNPDPNKFSSEEKIKNASRQQIYSYIEKPTHNIYFAGARLSELNSRWKKFINLRQNPAILTSLYSMEKTPHSSPQPNDRGLQIVNEFYKLANEWLK